MSRERRGTLRLYRQDMVAEATPLGRVRRQTLRLASTGKKGFSAQELAAMMADPEALDKASGAPTKIQGPRMKHGDERGVGDMIKIDTLTVESLVENLRERYDAERYYTYCGSILVALNPYYYLHGTYYTPSIIEQYKNRRLGEEPPHLFAIADSAYRQMLDTRKSISVIISGESGAGKTETTKLILNYLSALNNQPTAIEAKLIESASLLEAFGNAKTVRNNNSSRFGKYIKILFDDSFRICGAEIETYLLEKSRVTVQTDNERNYHIFYQLCAGAPPAMRQKYQLKPATEFEYTKECTDIGNDEAQEFKDTVDALTLFGFSKAEQDFVFSLCAAFLHLGNLKFREAGQKCQVANPPCLQIAAKLLGLQPGALNKVLTSSVLRIRGQVITKNLSVPDACNTRDTLCRQLYSRMFDWIVTRVTAGLRPTGRVNPVFLGVLDIFGFENFSKNSFEQLCINYANEKLHQQFIDHVFKQEQREYQAEGIKWSSVGCEDNEPCIQLIENRPMGILSVLDEESRLATGSDDGFLRKIHQNFDRHKHYDKPRLNFQELFGVKHYAEMVVYSADGFREKNQNVMQDDVLEVVQGSSRKLMALLFKDAPTEAPAPARGGRGGGRGGGTGRGGATNRGKPVTVGGFFKSQLVNLKSTLDNTVPFYIRCIKPNMQQKDHMFDVETVGKQLAYSGMVETVKIRALGFPIRHTLVEFYGRYKAMMGGSFHPKSLRPGDFNSWFSSRGLPANSYQVGRSKVFLRYEAAEVLDRDREEALRKHVVCIQAHWRSYQCRKHYDDMLWGSDVLQNSIRIWLHNRRLQQQVVASLAISRAMEAERRAEEERIRREEERRQREEEERRKREAEIAAASSRKEKQRLQKAEELRRKKEEEAAAAASAAPTESKAGRRRTFLLGGRKDAAGGPAKPSAPPRKKGRPPPGGGGSGGLASASSAAAVPEEKRRELARAEADFQRQKAAFDERNASSASSDPRYAEDIRKKIAEIDSLPTPTDPHEIITLAKGLQRKVRGQKPEVADKLYSRAVELYKMVLQQFPSQDNYINCGTAMINWGNLRLIMPQHAIKEEACVPLLNIAHQMLEKAISMGLDPEGMDAVQTRLSKVENLKAIAVREDMKRFSSAQREQMIDDLTLKLEQVKAVTKIGKLQKQGGGTGTLGRKSWKKRLFVLSEKYVRYYAKSTNEKPKGEIDLIEVTGVKEFPIPGKQYCFAITTETRFYPVVCNDSSEMTEWIRSVQTNVGRLRMMQKLDNFRAATSF